MNRSLVFKRLLTSTLVLGAGSTALALGDGAICTADGQSQGLCFVSPGGFVVEAVTGRAGQFPIINGDGDSVFSYRITGPAVDGGSCQGVHDISHADILLPLCSENPFVIVEASPAPEILDPGHGDPSCGFGGGDTGAYVFKWDSGVSCHASEIYTLVLAGTVQAEPRPFLLKAGRDCDEAMILGPACTEGPFVYCEGGQNSVGDSGSIGYSGSISISENNFFLTATGLPPEQPGFFFYGTKQIQVPFGNGFRCIGGQVTRYRKIGISVMGDTAVHLDFELFPLTTIEPGIPYYFQLFYRDAPAGGAGFNTTDALCVTFVP